MYLLLHQPLYYYPVQPIRLSICWNWQFNEGLKIIFGPNNQDSSTGNRTASQCQITAYSEDNHECWGGLPGPDWESMRYPRKTDQCFSYLLTYSMVQSPSWEATCLQLVKKFPTFHGTRRFITALTGVRHLSLSWASPIQSIYPHPTSWRSILILSTYLCLGLPSLFPYTPPSPYPYAPHAQPVFQLTILNVNVVCTCVFEMYYNPNR